MSKEILKSIAGPLTGGISDVVGAVITSKGNQAAAKTQAASDAAALAQAKEIYEQQRQDQGPYRESGYGAMDALNFGLGLPAVARSTTPAKPPNQVPMMTPEGVGGSATGTLPWNTALNKSVAGVNQAMTKMNSGALGPTTKVSKGGVTRVIPSSLLQKALGDGYQEVQ